MNSNYGELKASVAQWLDRTDLTDQIPDFIRMAETEIYRDLECEDNEFIATYTNAGWEIDGHASQPVSDGIFTDLPQNFRRMTLVTWSDKPLEHVSKQQMQVRINNYIDSTTNIFSISGRKISLSSAIDTDPTNWGDGEALIFTYYGAESLDSLPTYQVPTNPVDDPAVEDNTPVVITQTDDNTTRMLQVNPDMYLHGALYFASLFLQSDADANKWGSLFNNALESMKQASKRSRFSGSTSQVRSAY